jgi:hypothetical protein
VPSRSESYRRHAPKMKKSKLLVIALVSAGLSLVVAAQAHEEKEEDVDMKSLS